MVKLWPDDTGTLGEDVSLTPCYVLMFQLLVHMLTCLISIIIIESESPA